MYQWLAFVGVLAAGTVATTVVGALAWRRRSRTPAAGVLALVMLGLTEWGLAETLGALSQDLAVQRSLALAIYPGVGVSVLGFFWLCLVSVEPDLTLSGRGLTLLSLEPVLITAAAATNGLHHGVIAQSWTLGDPALLVWTAGPVFWVHTAYSYALLGWGVWLVVRHWPAAGGLQRRQLGTLLLAAVPPLVANLVSLTGFAGDGAVDLSVFGMILTGLVDGWAVLRLGLVQVLPVARAKVLEQLGDAVVVLDPQGRVLDVNAAAQALLPRIDRATATRLSGWLRARVQDPTGGETATAAGRLSLPDREMDLDLRADTLRDRAGRLIGQVVVARDVTEVRCRERELAAANARLEEMVRTVEALRADLAEQAVRDPLTGLHNRRYLMDELTRRLADAARTGEPLSLVLLDVDHFKQVNDHYGHRAGDHLLTAIAATLRDTAREDDTVARFGGEEFVVVLPRTLAKAAWTRAEEWRRLCARLRVPMDGGEIGATFSAGVASWPDCGQDLEALLEAADRALYRAKSAGRDRVELAAVAA